MLSASGVLAAVRWAAVTSPVSGSVDMGLVPVPFAGPGLVTVPGFGVHRRYGPISGHTPRYPPSAFPGIRFHILARNHSQQTYCVGCSGPTTASISASPSVTKPLISSDRLSGDQSQDGFAFDS